MTHTRLKWAAPVAAGLALLISGASVYAQQAQPDEDQREFDRAGQQQNQQLDQPQRQGRELQPQPGAQGQQFGQPPQRQPEREGVMLGVAIEPSPTTGVLIRDVMPGGAAERAGLRRGDYILSLDEERISSPQQFEQMLSQMQPGGQADLTIWRNEQEQQLRIDLAAQQQAAFRGQPQSGEPLESGQAFQQQGGRQSQAWLGVILSEQQDDQQRGARVMQVYPSGPAARAGLNPGDVITRVGDSQVSSAQELVNRLSRRQPDEQIELTLLRDGNEQTVEVTLGSRTDFLGDEGFAQGGRMDQFGDFDQFGVPEHAMMLEQHRHLASQHQRLENLLLDLREEVRSLRREVQALSGRGAARGPGSRDSGRSAPGLPQPPEDDEFRDRESQRPALEGARQR